MTATTYTFVPTVEAGSLADEAWVATLGPYSAILAHVREVCEEHDWNGAHVFAGAHGAIVGPEGYEDNYHGWIDARQTDHLYAGYAHAS